MKIPKVSRSVRSFDVSWRRLSILAIGVVFILAVAVACGQIGTASQSPAPAPSTDQILAETTKASAAATGVTVRTDKQSVVESIGGVAPEKVTISSDTTSTVDLTNKELQVTINSVIELPDLSKQTATIEIYIVDGWAYGKFTTPEEDGQWLKTRMIDDLWRAQSQIDQQMEILNTATDIAVVGTEDLGGTESYAIEITPNMEIAVSYLVDQLPSLGAIDFQFLDVSSLIKETAFKQWIAKDNYLLTKQETHTSLEIPPDSVGATTEDFEKITVAMDITANYDYDQPGNIVLPEDASVATEVANRSGQ